MIGKYPRTFNLPWSGSESSDDVWWKDTGYFAGQLVVITEKLDGECTGMTQEECHARSLDSRHHMSRSWVKSLHGGLAHRFPSGWKVFGENLFAWHSIFYTELPSYFFVFGVYDDSNRCLSWADTRQFCREFGLETVPTIWEGVWDEALVKDLWNGQGRFPTFASKVDPATHTPQFPADFQPCEAEGYVVRIADQFHYTDFSTKVAKYVRKHHVQTTSNWMTRPVVRNLLQQ